MEPNIEVIVLSDDEDTGNDHAGALDDSSVLIVEDVDKGLTESSEILDGDMTITFSRKANVLPHARYDCSLSFSFTDANVSEPESCNAAYCEQCFCYICDHLASQCKLWTVFGFCHCNAHKRSVYWKSLRDKSIMGYLHELKFSFKLEDMDSDLRHAETFLQEFAHTLALKYGEFLTALRNPTHPLSCACLCHSISRRAAESGSEGCSRCHIEHQKLILYDYNPVLKLIHKFLEDTVKENPKTGSVMILGAVKLFTMHLAPGLHHALAILPVLFELVCRAVSMVQAMLVDADFPTSFVRQLQDFFQILPLPYDFRKLRNVLNVLFWDDPLLSAVLKGQNISGVRHVKGRRPETLEEDLVVVRSRVLKLQQQNRYRELARYLRVVKSTDFVKLQMMKDWIPLYLCKAGDYSGAVDSLLSPVYGSSCPASRLSPAQFGAYFRILIYGHTPSGIPIPPQVHVGQGLQNVAAVIPTDPLLSSTWTPIEGGFNLLKRPEVLKFALRVLNCNSAVYTHAESWINVLKFANLSSSTSSSSSSLSSSAGPDALCLPEPDYTFLIRTRDMARGILCELHRTSRIQIPKGFQNGFQDQALLLLATQALAERLLHSRLKPVLTVILTFKSNPWVMRCLFSSLLVQPQMLQDLLCVILEELMDTHCRLVLRVQDAADQFFMASFLCLFFLEPNVPLHPNTHPVSDLLAKWNELENPWQYHLRRMLEVKESILNTEKQQILSQMIQWGLDQ